MRIYPDPELPDVVVEWFAGQECQDDDDRVVVSLRTVDPAAEVGAATAACRDGSVRFDDVARVRYLVAAKLEDTAGAELGSQDLEIDLRDGLSEKVFAFFGRPPPTNLRAAWTFDLGASCASLSATTVVLRASMFQGPTFFLDAPCDAGVLVDALPLDGMYTVLAFAVSIDTIVAAAPETAPFPITRGAIADLGTLTLSPCGTECPSPEPE